MTTGEANRDLEKIEREIRSEYDQLLEEAHKEGEDAKYAVAKKTTANTFMPLIISLIGIVLSYYSYDSLATKAVAYGLVILGIYLAFKMHGSAQALERQVENLSSILESTIVSHRNI